MEDHMQLATPMTGPLLPSPAFSFSTTGGSGVPSVTSARVGARLRRLGEKLHFWRKSPATVDDVYDAVRAAFKAQEKSRWHIQRSGETLRSWAEQLPDPGLRDVVHALCTTLMALNDPNPDPLVATVTSKLGNLNVDEQSRDTLTRALVAAERSYYKALYHGQSAAQVDVLESQYQMLRVQVDAAETRYRSASTQAVLNSFHSLLNHLTETQRSLEYACNGGYKSISTFNERLSPSTHTRDRHNHTNIDLDRDLDRDINRGLSPPQSVDGSLSGVKPTEPDFGFGGWQETEPLDSGTHK